MLSYTLRNKNLMKYSELIILGVITFGVDNYKHFWLDTISLLHLALLHLALSATPNVITPNVMSSE